MVRAYRDFFGNTKMTIYLPLEKYSSLHVDNDTGDIKIKID